MVETSPQAVEPQIQTVALFTSDYGPGNHPSIQLTFRTLIEMHGEGVNIIVFSFKEPDKTSTMVHELIGVIGDSNIVDLSKLSPLDAAKTIVGRKPDMLLNIDGHTNSSMNVFQLVKEFVRSCTWLSLPLIHGDGVTIVDGIVILGQERELESESHQLALMSCYHCSGLPSIFPEIRSESSEAKKNSMVSKTCQHLHALQGPDAYRKKHLICTWMFCVEYNFRSS